jgi:hypothetical protein
MHCRLVGGFQSFGTKCCFQIQEVRAIYPEYEERRFLSISTCLQNYKALHPERSQFYKGDQFYGIVVKFT